MVIEHVGDEFAVVVSARTRRGCSGCWADHRTRRSARPAVVTSVTGLDPELSGRGRWTS
jgi:hypothetical protein